MPFPNTNLRLYLKQRISSILTCYDSVAKKDKIKYCRKFIFMIDEWKNPLKDPFFFVKLDHIDSYKPSKYCSNQGCTLFVLAYDFFPSSFEFNLLRFFPLVLSKSLSNWIILLIPCTDTFHIIIERGWRSGGLFFVLNTVPFTAICQFVFIGICHLCYSSVIFFPNNPCFILLSPHIGGNRCFQGSICTWRGVHIYFFDGEIKILVDFYRVSPIITGSSTGIMPKSQHTILGWQNAGTGTFLWYQ